MAETFIQHFLEDCSSEVLKFCWMIINYLHRAFRFYARFGDFDQTSSSQQHQKDESESFVYLTDSHPVKSKFVVLFMHIIFPVNQVCV